VKRSLLFFSVALILLLSLMIAGCTQTAPGTAPAPSPAPSPKPAATITLKYADQNPDNGWEGQNAAAPWLKQIETATKGAVKTQGFYAQSLFKGTDAWESLKAGQADFAWCFHGYWANMTSLADVMALPFLPVPSAEAGSSVFWQLYQKYPNMQKQFADNKVVLTWTSQPYFLVMKTKPVKTLDDFKGLKIRTIGGPPTEQVKALGGIPVAMGMPDTYLNLDKGVIDGMFAPWEALLSFKQYEVAKYFTYAPFHAVYFTQAFSLKTWNSLPPDVQNGITSVSGLEGSKFWGKNMFDGAAAEGRNMLKAKNIPIEEYTMPADEIARWSKIGGEPLWDVWVKNQTDKGFPEAKDILADALKMLSQYK
jgi:TRAP-type transport system periplasmic protein